MKKRSLFVLLALAACQTVAAPEPKPVSPEPLARVDAGAIRDNTLETAVDASVPAPPVPPPRWGKMPEASGELFSVVDGACRHLDVSVLENETFVTFGDSTFARLTDDGIVVDPALSKGLDQVGSGLKDVVGHWPDRAYAIYDNGGRCFFADLASRWDGSKWRPAFAIPQYMGVGDVTPYGGGALGWSECPSCMNDPDPKCKEGVLMGDNAKPPPFGADGFKTWAVRALPSGEAFALGELCSTAKACTIQFRAWAPGASVTKLALGPKVESDARTSMSVHSPSDVWLMYEEALYHFDGTKLDKLPAPGKKHNWVLGADPAGTLWLLGDDKAWTRRSDGAFDDVSPPDKASVAGAKTGAPWAYTKNALYKRTNGTWQKVDLPRPPYTTSDKAYLTPESVIVRGPDDVIVMASYFEQEPGWGQVEKRRTLLRTKRPAQTLRCSATGALMAWPPAATDECKTPFVYFSEVASTSPKNFDYPTTRKILASKVAMIEGGEIAELRENDRIWNGVVPKTLADGRALAELYAKQFPMSRPEVVCATPNITRKIPIVR